MEKLSLEDFDNFSIYQEIAGWYAVPKSGRRKRNQSIKVSIPFTTFKPTFEVWENRELKSTHEEIEKAIEAYNAL